MRLFSSTLMADLSAADVSSALAAAKRNVPARMRAARSVGICGQRARRCRMAWWSASALRLGLGLGRSACGEIDVEVRQWPTAVRSAEAGPGVPPGHPVRRRLRRNVTRNVECQAHICGTQDTTASSKPCKSGPAPHLPAETPPLPRAKDTGNSGRVR